MSLGHMFNPAKETPTEFATTEDVQDEAGFFQGTPGAVGAELAMAARSVAILGGAIPAAVDWFTEDDNMTGESLSDRYFKLVDEPTKKAVEYFKPPVAGVGGRVAGAVIGGLAELVASPALLIARQQAGTAIELVDQGVDPTTAQIVGGAQGIATAAGIPMGAIGKTMAMKAVTGAAGNLATNVPAAVASQIALEEGGYAQQAKQFDPWNVEARAIDVLLGAAFGGVAHISQKREAMAVARALHFDRDAAPGQPLTQADTATHHAAMGRAMDQMARREPVDVIDVIKGAEFTPRQASPELETQLKALLPEDAPTLDAAPEVVPRETPTEFAKPEIDAIKTSDVVAATDDVEILVAREMAARMPDDARIDIGDEEVPNVVGLKEAWDNAEKEAATAENDSGAFLAAIKCYLGG